MKKIIAMMLLLGGSLGFAVSPFSLPWMNHAQQGSLYSSADHPNAVFVIEGYYYNCPYCHENAPNVDDLAEEYMNEERVQVLDVSFDRSDSYYQMWVQKHRPNHPVLKDVNRKLINQLNISGYPSTFVVDSRGTIRYRTSGVWSSSTKMALLSTVEKVLSED